MKFSEVLWLIVAAFLALFALFTLVAMLFNLLHPRVIVTWFQMFFKTLLIAAAGGLAYGIWINFLR